MRRTEEAAKSGREVRVGSFGVSNRSALFFIAGPCAMESEELLSKVGRRLKAIFSKAGLNWVLKCSLDKANRSSINSYRGLGFKRGLNILKRVKAQLGVPVLTDIHESAQAEAVAEVADVLQIPAFLCRQTDLLVAAGRTGKPVNIKKGQFLSPWDMANAIEKVESTGNKAILLTERGTTFGYSNLVVDMRSLEILRRFGYPVVFDATHSCQLPGALGHATGGERAFAFGLARAAAAVGVAGIFMETHPNPEHAKSDGPNSLRLEDVPAVVHCTAAIDRLIKEGAMTEHSGSNGCVDRRRRQP